MGIITAYIKNPTQTANTIIIRGSIAVVNPFTRKSDSDSKYWDSLSNTSSIFPVSSPTATICPTMGGNISDSEKAIDNGNPFSTCLAICLTSASTTTFPTAPATISNASTTATPAETKSASVLVSSVSM